MFKIFFKDSRLERLTPPSPLMSHEVEGEEEERGPDLGTAATTRSRRRTGKEWWWA